MTGGFNVEYEHCRELAANRGGLFEFTSRFAPPERINSLTALYALHLSIGGIPAMDSDDSVKWAKLKWWSEELAADAQSPSRHPVLGALRASGAMASLDIGLLQKLVADAAMQVDAAPDSDEHALFGRLADAFDTEIRLELSLDDAEIGEDHLRNLAAASRLYRLVSSFAPHQRPELERIPLSLLARYGVTVDQLAEQRSAEHLPEIIGHLADYGMEWFSKGLLNLEMKPEAGLCRHLQLRWAMEQRQLARIGKNPQGFLKAGLKTRPSDAWFAWRFLRSLK